jgi:hypothetical protein
METAKMPTTNEWIKKMWHLYIMEFYLGLKMNEILSFAGKWMELENIILSEVRQAQTIEGHMFSLIHRIQIHYKYRQYYEKQVTLSAGHI